MAENTTVERSSAEWLAGYNEAIREALEEFKHLTVTTPEASQVATRLQDRIGALGE